MLNQVLYDLRVFLLFYLILIVVFVFDNISNFFRQRLMEGSSRS